MFRRQSKNMSAHVGLYMCVIVRTCIIVSIQTRPHIHNATCTYNKLADLHIRTCESLHHVRELDHRFTGPGTWSVQGRSGFVRVRSGEVQGSFGVVRRSVGSRSRFVRKFFEKFFEKFLNFFSKNS